MRAGWALMLRGWIVVELWVKGVFLMTVLLEDREVAGVGGCGGLGRGLRAEGAGMLSGLRARYPKLHVKAFTAIEINHLTKIGRMSTREVLIALKEAGLGSMPGGGAEVFDDRVHDAVFKGKLRADGWMEVHRTAHQLGLRTNATILYGHVETREERIKHLLALRELQNQAP